MPDESPLPPAQPLVPPVPSLIAIAGWLCPGLGYFLIGQRFRAIVSGSTILTLFLAGLLIAGVRCVDVPGFDADGHYRTGAGALANNKTRAILEKPWYIPQVLAGPISIAASVASVNAAGTYDKTVGRLWDIGTLYTAVAGMLNLLVILDSAHRAGKLRDDNTYPGPM